LGRAEGIVSEYGVSRRNLICGFMAAGAAVPILAACGSDSSSGASTGTGTSGGATGGASSGGSSSGGSSSGASAGSIKTSEIPVGGGKVFPDRSLIVTQPTAGEFKAFTSTCTHQGTTINKVEGGDMVCPLHGSRFAITDGAVDQGPATSPLPEKTVKVTGDTLEVFG
jgi:nitrite reductase/ring-hydroxylating ferredoxin subunit